MSPAPAAERDNDKMTGKTLADWVTARGEKPPAPPMANDPLIGIPDIFKGPMGRIYDVLAIWKERGVNVTGKGLGGGHNLQEDVPNEVLAELRPFLKG